MECRRGWGAQWHTVRRRRSCQPDRIPVPAARDTLVALAGDPALAPRRREYLPSRPGVGTNPDTPAAREETSRLTDGLDAATVRDTLAALQAQRSTRPLTLIATHNRA